MNDHELTHALKQRADDFARLGGHDMDLARVVSRAGEIRRGRRMRASIVMAAVAMAIAVPVGVVAIGDDSAKREPNPPVATQSAARDGSPIGLGALKTGKAPSNGYAYAETLFGSQTSTDLETGSIIELAGIEGGFLVAQADPDNGTSTVSFVDADGNRVGNSFPYDNSGFAVSAERNVGAFVEPDGTVIAIQDAGSRSYVVGELPPGDTYQADAVIGENCSGRSEAPMCAIYAHSNGNDPKVWTISPHGVPSEAFDGFRKLTGITEAGLAGGLTSVSDTGSCWEVRPTEGGQPWGTCDSSFIEFTPDGKYLLATTAYRSGAGDSQLTILDARTGAVVLDLKTVPDAFLVGQRWEDSTHVLASVFDHGTWAIERFDVNGNREYASEKVPDHDSMVSPFRLG